MKLYKLFIGLLSAIEQVVMICSFLSLCSVVFRLNINIARSVIGRLIAWCPCVCRLHLHFKLFPWYSEMQIPFSSQETFFDSQSLFSHTIRKQKEHNCLDCYSLRWNLKFLTLTWINQLRKGMVAVELATLLCMHLLFLRNNSGNNGWPFGAAHFVFGR